MTKRDSNPAPAFRIPRLLWVVLPLAYLIYFFGLGAVGLLGPDEPRYASVAREMARSGDWITPRLWGQPWFEKPVLLYWMSGAAFKLGMSTELAPRLPVALLAAGFLGFYWWILRREFGCRAAWLAALILGSSGMWIGYSQVGVTDVPLTATFSAAMLLALPWVARRDTRFLPAVSAMLGLAVLAKGLVPLALAMPLVLPLPPALAMPLARRLRDLLKPRVIAPFCAVALPWYLLCYWRNGWPFLYDFIVVHHFSRFTSNALMHGQPWWFYLPVLAGAMLPWTPLWGLLMRPRAYHDPRRVFLLAWILFGVVLFSTASSKLPGYPLPLLPAAAALMAVMLDEIADARPWLVCCGLLLAAFPIVAQVLPAAVSNGLSRAPRPVFQATWLAAATAAAAACVLERRGRRLGAVLVLAAGVAAGVVYLKTTVAAELDRSVSARGLWREIGGRAACIDSVELKKDWRYGLNYYSVTPLPDCREQSEPLWVRPAPGGRALLSTAP